MAQGPNPFVYVFPAVLLVAVALYFGYGALDRVGLATMQGEAQVTGKQVTPASTTYTTEVIGGRTMTRANQNPEAYVVTLQVGGETTGAAVSQDVYESLRPGTQVQVSYRRTRISKRLVVTDVRR